MGSDTAKPFAAAKTAYFPGANPLNVYTPSLFVVAVFAVPDASFKVTVAPTIAAPNSSTTSPRKLLRPCAKLIEVKRASANRMVRLLSREFEISFMMIAISATAIDLENGKAQAIRSLQMKENECCFI